MELRSIQQINVRTVTPTPCMSDILSSRFDRKWDKFEVLSPVNSPNEMVLYLIAFLIKYQKMDEESSRGWLDVVEERRTPLYLRFFRNKEIGNCFGILPSKSTRHDLLDFFSKTTFNYKCTWLSLIILL